MYTILIMCNHVCIHTIFAKSFLQAEALVLAIAGGTELVTKIFPSFPKFSSKRDYTIIQSDYHYNGH